MNEPLTPELVGRYQTLDGHGRELLRGFAEAFPGSTIEWIKRTPEVQDQRRRFLDTLFRQGDGYMEFRAIRPAPKHIKREWIPAGDHAGAEAFCDRWARTHNVYVGVAARFRIGGTTADCGVIRCLFADVDFKKIPKATAWERIRAFPLPPTMIVASGGGFHLYWSIDPPYDLRFGTAPFKRRLRAVAKAIGGDLACAEPAHILRVPGTPNHKYTPTREVHLVQP